MKKENWVWMPHPGHFICAKDCKFHLNTYVGEYIVSTVGEMWPDSRVREMYAKIRGKEIKGRGDEWDRDYMEKIGFEEIGCDRKYETMVFKAEKAPDTCCPYRMVSGEKDFSGYNTSEEAMAGHMDMCLKWSNKN